MIILRRRRLVLTLASLIAVLVYLSTAPVNSAATPLGRATGHSMRILKWRTPEAVAVVVPSFVYPPSVYPYSPRAAEGFTKAGCPAPVRLSSLSSTLTPSDASHQIDALSKSETSALGASDTTMWPNIVLIRPLAQSSVDPSRLIVIRERFSNMSVTIPCGVFTTNSTWVAEVCPTLKGVAGTSSCSKDPALVKYYYFVKRAGHWLNIFIYG